MGPTYRCAQHTRAQPTWGHTLHGGIPYTGAHRNRDHIAMGHTIDCDTPYMRHNVQQGTLYTRPNRTQRHTLHGARSTRGTPHEVTPYMGRTIHRATPYMGAHRTLHIFHGAHCTWWRTLHGALLYTGAHRTRGHTLHGDTLYQDPPYSMVQHTRGTQYTGTQHTQRTP